MSGTIEPYTGAEIDYEVTNLSSRTFIFGDLTLLPKIPQTVNGTQKHTIEQSKYGTFFEFKPKEEPPVR